MNPSLRFDQEVRGPNTAMILADETLRPDRASPGSYHHHQITHAQGSGSHEALVQAVTKARDSLQLHVEYIPDYDLSLVQNPMSKKEHKRHPQKGIKKLSADEITDVFRYQHERILEHQERFEEMIPGLYERTEARIQAAVEAGCLPEVALERFLVEKEATRWLVTDSLGVYEHGEVRGSTNAFANFAYISFSHFLVSSLREQMEGIEHTFTHEMVHRLEPTTGIAIPNDHCVIGITFGVSRTNANSDITTNKGLNEAITERITQGLLHGKWDNYEPSCVDQVLIYPTEQITLQAITERVPLALFINYFFSEHRPGKPNLAKQELHRAFRERLGITYDDFIAAVDLSPLGTEHSGLYIRSGRYDLLAKHASATAVSVAETEADEAPRSRSLSMRIFHNVSREKQLKKIHQTSKQLLEIMSEGGDNPRNHLLIGLDGEIVLPLENDDFEIEEGFMVLLPCILSSDHCQKLSAVIKVQVGTASSAVSITPLDYENTDDHSAKGPPLITEKMDQAQLFAQLIAAMYSANGESLDPKGRVDALKLIHQILQNLLDHQAKAD